MGFSKSPLVMAAMSYLVDISNFLVVCNSSANFCIYFAFGQSFRKTLKLYLCGKGTTGRILLTKRMKNNKNSSGSRQNNASLGRMSSSNNNNAIELHSTFSDLEQTLNHHRHLTQKTPNMALSGGESNNAEARLKLLAGPTELLI